MQNCAILDVPFSLPSFLIAPFGGSARIGSVRNTPTPFPEPMLYLRNQFVERRNFLACKVIGKKSCSGIIQCFQKGRAARVPALSCVPFVLPGHRSLLFRRIVNPAG